jgi:transcriptional regulator with XRE-family HTH domain
MHFPVMKVLLDYLDLTKMTNVALARKLGCSESYISYLLSGARVPSTRMLNKMHETLGISYDELFKSLPQL